MFWHCRAMEVNCPLPARNDYLMSLLEPLPELWTFPLMPHIWCSSESCRRPKANQWPQRWGNAPRDPEPAQEGAVQPMSTWTPWREVGRAAQKGVPSHPGVLCPILQQVAENHLGTSYRYSDKNLFSVILPHITKDPALRHLVNKCAIQILKHLWTHTSQSG